MKREFDAVIFGATSFVGQILVHYLWERHGIDGDLKWALAGRSEAKLKQVRGGLGTSGAALPLIVADAADENALRGLCQRTRSVCSTVGPFALYGSPLVKVCAETGTDYCDSTGELQWIARMIAAHEATAEKSGARLLHCCGFDSVPSDMGVFFLQQQAQARFGEPCQDVRLRVKRLDGGASGGTIASILNLVKEARRDRSLTQLINNPYGLSPTAPVADPREPTAYMPKYDAVSGSWQAPFLMAPTNAQIVHRSNAMLDYAWGRNFAYDEAMMMGSGLGGRMKAYGMSAGLAGLMSTLAFAPTRGLLEKFVVPKPGTGPSPAQQAKGGYDLRFFGKTEKGEMLKTRVTGNLDPGYGSTSRMLGETVACLAKDLPEADRKGGFYTTASLLGDKLLARLQQYAGLGFHLLS